MLGLGTAKAELIAKLSALKAPSFPALAGSADMLAARDHLNEVAKAVDEYIHAIGMAAKGSTGSIFSADLFKGVLWNALDNGPLYELEAVAEEIAKPALAEADRD